MQIKGLFITFEGADGCGKTTISKKVQKMLQDYLKDESKVVWTREPGGTEVSEKIREIITQFDMNPKTEALLFAAARTEHTWKNIMENKKLNRIVLCDRYLNSSEVYQGIVKKLTVKDIDRINYFGIGKIRPDMTFFLDVSVDEALERQNMAGREGNDRLENEFSKKEELTKVINGYYSILKFDNIHTFRIDASSSIEDISKKIFDIIISRVTRNAKK